MKPKTKTQQEIELPIYIQVIWTTFNVIGTILWGLGVLKLQGVI